MKLLTPFKVAMCLSLMIHAGMIGGYYAFWRQPAATQAEPDQVVEIEVVSEPMEAPEPATVPAPVAPKPVPQPAPVQPTPEVKTVVPQVAVATLPPPTEVAPEPAKVPQVETMETPAVSTPPKPVTAATPTPAPVESGSPANYLLNPHPAYPAECRRRKQEGLVVLAVQVSREGLPGAIKVVQSSNVPLLDEAAQDAIAHWRFTPARMGGAAVASQIEVPVRFKLTNSK